MTADEKYYLLKRDSSTQPIQILASQKEKTFPQFFSAFLNYRLNFGNFQKKKGDPHRRSFFEITGPGKGD